MSDYKGAALILPAMPKAKELLADKGYDADWFRATLAKRGGAVCIPRNPIESSRSPLTPSSTSSATRSKTCSGVSKTGAHPHPIRSLRPHLPIGSLHRRSRPLLALIKES